MDSVEKNILLAMFTRIGLNNKKGLEEYSVKNNMQSCQELIEEFETIQRRLFSHLWDITYPNKQLNASAIIEESKSFCSNNYPWIDEKGLKALNNQLLWMCDHEGILLINKK